VKLRPTNIRTRLTLWYVGVLALLLVAYAMVVFAFQYAALTHQLYHDEVQDVVTVEGLLTFDQYGKLHLTDNYYSRPQSHLLIDRLMEVRDLSGSVLYQSATLHGMSLGGPLKSGEGDRAFDERILELKDGSHAFVISHIHTMQGLTVVIRLGYDLAPLRARMFQFFLLLLVAIPVALLIAALAGQAIARRALRPLDRMTLRAERITASNLAERLEVANPNDELGSMARVFNLLLQRLEEAFEQLKRFTADASHELRTPLAAIRTISEVALEKSNDADAYRDALSSVLEESARLNQTVDGLLLLAMAERSLTQTHPAFVFSDLVDEVVSLLEILGEEREVRIVQQHLKQGKVEVHADRALMRIALSNVLHNALKFTPDNSTITVDYTSENLSSLRVSVKDDGPGIPSGEEEKVFERFFTGSAGIHSSHTGAGLGLSIAKLIVNRSGGQIHFADTSISGATCIITLPLK
jgi:heavy metal sensor kinase